jgi:hypothetical protein
VMSCPIHDYAAPGGSPAGSVDDRSGSANDRTGSAGYVSPTLIIIGKVAALHDSFKWLPDSDSRELYFKPVTNHKLKAEERA